MIAIDTNILVYAHRPHFEAHARCRAAIEGLVHSGARFALPWPCLHEFIGVVTNARVFSPPTPVGEAVAFLDDFAALPNCQFLGETTTHLGMLADLLRTPGVAGPRVHDARIAAICLAHGVSELWTADRDFSYFPRLRTRNPVVLSGRAPTHPRR
jgi:uncharacterized protein